MTVNDTHDEEPVGARIPADLDAPDRIVAGLSARQMVVLAVAGVPAFLAWQHLSGRVPWQVLTGVTLVLGALAVAAAMGTRDGVSLDAWALAAIRYRVGSRHRPSASWKDIGADGGLEAGRTSLAEQEDPWPQEGALWPGAALLPAPVADISERGVLVLADGRRAALVASSTVTTVLSTHGEDAVLAAGTAQWLNSLSGPVQILVRSRPADLTDAALDLAARAGTLAHPDLARAALDHAEFLLDINEFEQPLHRSVIIACCDNGFTPPAGTGAGVLARLGGMLPAGRGSRPGRSRLTEHQRTRAESQVLAQAERTVEHLQGIGARARVLGVHDVLTVLEEVWDPFALRPGTEPDARPADRATAAPVPEEGPDAGLGEGRAERADLSGDVRTEDQRDESAADWFDDSGPADDLDWYRSDVEDDPDDEEDRVREGQASNGQGINGSGSSTRSGEALARPRPVAHPGRGADARDQAHEHDRHDPDPAAPQRSGSGPGQRPVARPVRQRLTRGGRS